MNDNGLRLECLRLAQHQIYDGGMPVTAPTSAIVARAREFADFVLGRKDGEVVTAARAFVEKVRDVSL